MEKAKSSEVGHGCYLLVNKTLCGPPKGPGRHLGESKPNRACVAVPCTLAIVAWSRNAISRSVCSRTHTKKKPRGSRNSALGVGQHQPLCLLNKAGSGGVELPLHPSSVGDQVGEAPPPCSFFPRRKLTLSAQ